MKSKKIDGGKDEESNLKVAGADDDLKKKSDELFIDLGTDITSANSYRILTEYRISDELEKSHKQAAQGRYKDATEVLA